MRGLVQVYPCCVWAHVIGETGVPVWSKKWARSKVMPMLTILKARGWLVRHGATQIREMEIETDA